MVWVGVGEEVVDDDGWPVLPDRTCWISCESCVLTPVQGALVGNTGETLAQCGLSRGYGIDDRGGGRKRVVLLLGLLPETLVLLPETADASDAHWRVTCRNSARGNCA